MNTPQKFLRFTASDRFEHWLQMLSFLTLGLTGLVQKFSSAPASLAVISALGGVETVRIIHRGAALVMMLGAIYHLGSVGYKIYVKRAGLTMLPSKRDFTAARDTFLFNLNRRKSRPKEGRYTFGEKIEYWAFVWGAVVMGVTGFMLWNPITTARILPGVVIPASKAAHSAEALLAILAIIIWHFYHVHLKYLNKSMFTGYLSMDEMEEEHPLELSAIEAGGNEQPAAGAERRRKRIFFPAYGAVTAALLLGVAFFVSGEKTALTTVPPAENVAVFVPYTPTPLPTPFPTPTPAITGAATWENGVADLFASRCSQCHGKIVLGGLNLSSYEQAMQGGQSGPVIAPGEPEASLLVGKQTEGGHPGQLSSDELKYVMQWIQEGAPEN